MSSPVPERPPLVSAIIPTVDGREDYLNDCLAGIANQSIDTEIIILRNRPTCGEAWVEGTDIACGDFVWYAADDVYPEAGFFEKMMEAVTAGFCPSATVYEPDGLLQSAGIMALDCYRPPELIDWMEVDHTTTPFLSPEQLALLHPFRDTLASLHYCSDTFVSAVLAKHQIKTVVRTDARLIHYNAAPGRGAGSDQQTRTAQDRATFERFCAEHLS